MEAKNDKKIGHWLYYSQKGTLCIPDFQRKEVWKQDMIVQFLETLILDIKSPLGVFLILETSSENFPFTPYHIKGHLGSKSVCKELLLDGQQRLKALWKALHDIGEYRYYVEFNKNFKPTKINKILKETKRNKKLSEDPNNEFKKSWFPVRLLNPLQDSEKVVKWIDRLNNPNRGKVKNLIIKLREFFGESENSKTIPYFFLPNTTRRKDAVEIYRTINSNSVKLSKHYLALAKMNQKTEKSLYEMADRLIEKVPDIKSLEMDEPGELILKISCLMQGKSLTRSNYDKLDFNTLIKNQNAIFYGIKWAVGQLNGLKIWHGRQLPSVVPLRVLPALYKFFPEGVIQKGKAKKIIKRYLWHAFLTDHYSRQANERLKKDFLDLKKCILGDIKEKDVEIFKTPSPDIDTIKKAGWPKNTAKGTLGKGILLACCQNGGKSLIDNEELNKDNFDKRTQHHIFPKSKVSNPHRALNCMLIPNDENSDYFKDDWPGDGIKRLFQDFPAPALINNILGRLNTHLISKSIAQVLKKVTSDNIERGEVKAEEVFNEFLDKRARLVSKEIKKLLRQDKV